MIRAFSTLRVVLTAAALLLSDSCAVAAAAEYPKPLPPKTVIHCDDEFTYAERTELFDAAKAWSEQTSGLADIKLVFDLHFDSTSELDAHVKAKHNLMVKMQSWMELVVEEDKASGAHLLGLVSPGGGMHNPLGKAYTVVFVADRLSPDAISLKQVAMHEFGHVLGIPHVYAANAILYPSAFPAKNVCLKQPDLSAFCASNVCGKSVMKPCE